MKSGGSQPLSRRRRAAKELPALFQSPEPSLLRKQRDGRAREAGKDGTGRGAAALNSKFGTNNADPCFVSPWEINASASAGLIAPYTPNSNNIYLRRGAARRGTARRGTATPGSPGSGKCDWFRRMRVRSFRDTQKSAAFHRSIGSPGASRRTLRPLVLFIACETLRWRARERARVLRNDR